MNLAREIKKMAIQRRGEELGWAAKGAYPDNQFQENKVPGGIRGGTSQDYGTLETGYEWIVQAFQYAIGPEPAGLDGLISSFDEVRRRLRASKDITFSTKTGKDGKVQLVESDASVAEAKLGSMKDGMLIHLEQWQGNAAMAFKDGFVSQFPLVTANQVLVATALKSAVDCNKWLYEHARTDLLDLARATKSALDFHGPCESVDVGIALSVVAGVTGIAASCVAGPGAIIAFTVIASGAGVTKDLLDKAGEDDKKPEPPKFKVQGYTVDDILSSCYELMQTITKAVTEGEDVIIDGLQKNSAVMTGATRQDFVSPKPSFASSPTSLAHTKGDLTFFPG
jgi:hypothetical protein